MDGYTDEAVHMKNKRNKREKNKSRRKNKGMQSDVSLNLKSSNNSNERQVRRSYGDEVMASARCKCAFI